MKPEYWIKAKRHLARNDPVLAKIIRAYPRVSIERRGEPFYTLARSIVGQQISVKAAQSIWNRVAALAPAMQPAEIIALRARTRRLKAAGLSDRKVEYIVDLAKHFAEGTIHPHRWAEMGDEEVIGELVQVRGIGRWTAEMFLMFHLGRPDVLPVNDVGINRAIKNLYELEAMPKPEEVLRIGACWRPWASVACWYLWRSEDVKLPGA